MEISTRDARRLFLNEQGLLRKDHFGRGKSAVQRAIETLSYCQIDTISVVERAHHHVLRSRVRNYTPSMLDALQVDDRSVFEYWAHAAAYLPISDYRYYLPIMAGARDKHRPADPRLAKRILQRIQAEGPLGARDFEDSRQGQKSSGWWDWKPAKLVLEQLFLCGEIMVTSRNGFQKVYDLPGNVLPTGLDTSQPTDAEWQRFLVTRQVDALGIATAYDIGYTRTAIRQLTGRNVRQEMTTAIAELTEDASLVEVFVAGTPYLTRPDLLDQLPLRLGRRRVTILSPFDNLVINRRRALALFGFDYQIECYVPAAKRRYGYFSLPILYGDELIGRMDAKAHRRHRELEIRNLVLEPRTRAEPALVAALADGIGEFAAGNGCDHVRVVQSEPASLASLLSLSQGT
ncbi:MAG: winged helix DNA-binding domain-containing protein [Proteobacteria bacterium]|jgi:uncharacterized protein YcaQ|nr:winged helix DNA-binding domain-containing protein [Pseudomonadota bacterium]